MWFWHGKIWFPDKQKPTSIEEVVYLIIEEKAREPFFYWISGPLASRCTFLHRSTEESSLFIWFYHILLPMDGHGIISWRISKFMIYLCESKATKFISLKHQYADFAYQMQRSHLKPSGKINLATEKKIEDCPLFIRATNRLSKTRFKLIRCITTLH